MHKETSEIWVCQSEDVLEGGLGIRFPITFNGEDATGFVVRNGGTVFGYVNRCAHNPIELDWRAGEFFEGSGLYIMCSTHGAVYEPQTGHCAGGPCRGGRLRVIQVMEKEGRVCWCPDENSRPVCA